VSYIAHSFSPKELEQARDGPPVVVPARKGFGSVLLEKLASQDFGAQPTITFAPHGLSYSIEASCRP
jgi:two-component sensor histidine kinase